MTFSNRKRPVHAPEVRESAAKSSGVALSSICCVEAEFLYLSVFIEVHVKNLRGQSQHASVFSILRLGPHEVVYVLRN